MKKSSNKVSTPSSTEDDKPKKQLSSSIASLRFMNRNKPATNSDSTNQLPSPALSFKSATSRVVKSSSNSSLSNKNNSSSATPVPPQQSASPSVASSSIQNIATPKNHKAEQWSYAQEGKLDQVINNTLSNYSLSTNQDTLLSSNSYACQEDNESIYSLNFYRHLEGEPTEETTSDYVRGGRLKFGTYKQEEIAITTEIDPSSALKRKKDDNIKLPIGISSTQNKKKKHKK